jgi:hypothetical protein
MDNLLPTETSFHGIVPGKPTYPLGAIHLDIIFDTPANFRKEKIEFEVVDWPSQYHATVDGFRVARTRGTTRRTQRFEHRGLNV